MRELVTCKARALATGKTLPRYALVWNYISTWILQTVRVCVRACVRVLLEVPDFRSGGRWFSVIFPNGCRGVSSHGAELDDWRCWKPQTFCRVMHLTAGPRETPVLEVRMNLCYRSSKHFIFFLHDALPYQLRPHIQVRNLFCSVSCCILLDYETVL